MGKYKMTLARKLDAEDKDEMKQEKLKKKTGVKDDSVYVKRSGLLNPDIPIGTRIFNMLLWIIIPLAFIGALSLLIRGCRENLFGFLSLLPKG